MKTWGQSWLEYYRFVDARMEEAAKADMARLRGEERAAVTRPCKRCGYTIKAVYPYCYKCNQVMKIKKAVGA